MDKVYQLIASDIGEEQLPESQGQIHTAMSYKAFIDISNHSVINIRAHQCWAHL